MPTLAKSLEAIGAGELSPRVDQALVKAMWDNLFDRKAKQQRRGRKATLARLPLMTDPLLHRFSFNNFSHP